MNIESDFGRMIADGQGDPEVTRDRQVAALLAHARSTTKALHGMASSIEGINASMVSLTGSVKTLQGEMKENTDVTTAVRDTLTAGRVATKLIKGMTIVGAGISAVYGAWWTWTHVGSPPPGG